MGSDWQRRLRQNAWQQSPKRSVWQKKPKRSASQRKPKRKVCIAALKNNPTSTPTMILKTTSKTKVKMTSNGIQTFWRSQSCKLGESCAARVYRILASVHTESIKFLVRHSEFSHNPRIW